MNPELPLSHDVGVADLTSEGVVLLGGVLQGGVLGLEALAALAAGELPVRVGGVPMDLGVGAWGRAERENR